MNKSYRSGFISIVGRPNVGKSTLINQIIGKKIAITSSKPQTTRDRITGILTTQEYQMIFVDTPGLHRSEDQLGKTINELAISSLDGVDVILMMVDKSYSRAEEHVLKHLENTKIPVILVINKIDLIRSRPKIDEVILTYLKIFPFAEIIPISASSGTHVEQLKSYILKYLPEGPKFYDDETITDQSDLKIMSEVIREKIIFFTHQEVPHAVHVIIESINDNKAEGTLDVTALIIVERNSQKGILIGKNGDMMKEIGRKARLEINELFDVKLYLTLWVKVEKDWRNNLKSLKKFGYND